jgi:predicted ATPase/class 3 adenylate cyclase
MATHDAQPLTRPTGNVSFLFTDIEESTQKWETMPSLMAGALEVHDRIMREAIAARDGFVFATGGDGFCLAFNSARDAVDAATQAQRELGRHTWPQNCELKVRMGIHAGRAVERAGDYFGPAVNLAARIMAAGHGGQLLCSASVAQLVSDRTATRSLGDHQLRGIATPVEICQVIADGLRQDFEPLRTVNIARTNLAYAAAPPIGREELAQTVVDALSVARLVTLTGVGGVGKTTLAVSIGRRILPAYADGVWLCELAATTESRQIFEAMAAALRFTPPSGVAVQDALATYLASRSLVMILDNCEHLVDAAANAAAWLMRTCPEVRILSTSRETLRIDGERVLAVPPLDVPAGDRPSDVTESPAGRLFVTRSTDANPLWRLDENNAAAVASICRNLDGIPLAVELAAARSRTLDANDIALRLGARFDLLAQTRRGADERHQTLRSTLEWSYELLEDDEQWLFRRLAVFVDGFDLDALVAIAADRLDEFEAFDILGSLIAKSLVELDSRAPRRFRLLETIRRFADSLPKAQADPSAGAEVHAVHYLRLARAAFEDLRKSDGADATERLAADAANLEAALSWFGSAGRAGEALDLFCLLPAPFLLVLPSEVTERLTRALEGLFDTEGSAAEASFSAACAAAGWLLGDVAEQDRWTHISDARGRVADDAYTALFDSQATGFVGDMAGGAAAASAGLGTLDAASDPLLRSALLAMLAIFENSTEPSRGLDHAEQAVALAREHGGSLVVPYALLALAMCTRDDVARCTAAANEARRLDRTVRRPFSSTATMLAAHAAATAGDVTSALPLLRESIAQIGRSGNRQILGITIGTAADAIAVVVPETALELVCIAESGAISPVGILDNPAYTHLRQIASEAKPDDLKARRAHYAQFSYDDALHMVMAALDGAVTATSRPERAE